jgi:hypothetical protein
MPGKNAAFSTVTRTQTPVGIHHDFYLTLICR